MRCLIVGLMMAWGFVTFAETASSTDEGMGAGFERFRTILDRMPFGPDPVGFDPDIPSSGVQSAGADGAAAGLDPQQQSEEAQRILAAVRVCMLNVTPSGRMAVGFTDTSVQPSKNYYLKVGDSRDGWLVKSADFAEKKVTLERDGVEAVIGVGENTGGGDAKKSGSAATGGRRGVRSDAAPMGGSGIASLRARRMQQQQQAEEKRLQEQEQRRRADEKVRQEQERVAAERQQVQEERERQRQQLLEIQEELRRQREQREAERDAAAAEAAKEENENVE